MEQKQISRVRYQSFIAEKVESHNKYSINDQGSVFLLTYPTTVFRGLDGKSMRLKWTETFYAKQLRSISGADDFFLKYLYALTMNLASNEFVIEADIVFKGKEVVITLLPVVKLPNYRTFSFHTIYSFLKELFHIEVCFKDETRRIREVYLFKVDMTNMMREEMKDLKDAIFATGNSSSVKDRTMSLSSRPFISRESQVLALAILECRLEADPHEAKHDNDIEVFDSTSEPPLLNVPFHILEMIMEHCFGLEYMNFRATCKRCYLAAPLTRCKMYSPWLMVLDNYQGIITFMDPLCGDKYFIKTPQELGGDCRIFCSRYGWLLMFKPDVCKLVFFNPFTNNIHKLPTTPCCLRSVSFSAPPTSPDCMVVGFTRDHVYIHFVSQEAPSWRRYPLDVGGNDPYSFHTPTFRGQDIYALCNNNKRIHAFRDFGEEDYSWEVVDDNAPRSCCRSSRTGYFLSKCDQNFLLVIVGEFGEYVEVFKLNDSTKEWEKMDDLGKHMIYVSDTSCICLEAKSSQMENKVYFPSLLHNSDTKIVFYSLETRGYHTFCGKNIQKSFGTDLCGTKQYYHPHTWIYPSWS